MVNDNLNVSKRGHPTIHKRFVIGVDRSKMRLYDVEENQQTLTDDTPVFDKTDTGKRFADFKL